MPIPAKPPAIFVLALALGCGLIAGTFFAFSTFVMRGLNQRPAPEAIAAMQSINVAVINPFFMAVFMGSAALSVVAMIWASCHRDHAATPWLLLGAALYLVGCFAVTVAGNVPLNDALALVKPGDANAAKIWADFSANWMLWESSARRGCSGRVREFRVGAVKIKNPRREQRGISRRV